MNYSVEKIIKVFLTKEELNVINNLLALGISKMNSSKRTKESEIEICNKFESMLDLLD